MSTTRIAVAQLAPVIVAPEVNLDLTSRALREAAAGGARLVVLPELSNSGYVLTDRDEALTVAEDVDGATVGRWSALAAELGLVVVGGFCERGNAGQVHNSAVIADPSGVRAVYRKVHLWDRERLIFTPGEAPPPVVDTAVGAVSTMVCYDLEFPEWVRIPALGGAQLLAAPSNWPAYPVPPGQRPIDVVRAQADAAVNKMAVAVADRVGLERGVDWTGGSTIVDADGWIVAGGDRSRGSGLLYADLDLTRSLDKVIGDSLSDIHADRRPDLYAKAPELTAQPR